jgi:hypothetical protein
MIIQAIIYHILVYKYILKLFKIILKIYNLNQKEKLICFKEFGITIIYI